MSMSFDKLVQELTELVEVNCHTEAYVLACDWLHDKDPSFMESTRHRMLAVRAEHERLGYMPDYLNGQRYKAYKNMVADAKAILSPEEHKRFYAAL